MKNQWQLHRAGLFNFWYYDEEEFNFSNGKLLLRGSNGSGKSVTMQSFIPVLLDGRKSPDRLDPFGSRARKMEDYLLGEKEVVDRDERTGYLYLEYKREGTEQYVTTGMGLRAKRHSPLEFWGFVITDNRRIGKDFPLYKTEYSVEEGQDQKIPLTRRELENRLEVGGKVVRTQKEYMELVNKHVFGFESIEAYEELIKLLIQLRSPKLSKDFKPTVIYGILNESLPSLSDEELRPLSDTIENMDQTKQQLDQLTRDHRSLNRLAKQYDTYNQYVLAEKAEGYLKAEQRREKLNKQGENNRKDIRKNEQLLQTYNEDFSKLQREQEVLKEEEEKLKEHDVFRAQGERKKVQALLRDSQDNLKKKQEALDKKKSQERTIRRDHSETEEKLLQAEKNILLFLEELDFAAEDTQFPHHTVSTSEFQRHYKTKFDFILWKKQAEEYAQHLDRILKVFREQRRVKERYDQAERELGEAHKELDMKRREELKWAQWVEEEKGKLLEAFHQWRKGNRELSLTENGIQLVSQHITRLYDPIPFEKVKEPVVQAYQLHYEQLKGESISLGHGIKQIDKEIQEKVNELNEWKRKKDPEPNRHPDTLSTRKKLEEEHIPHLPLYSAVEFHEHVPPHVRERLEAAITNMGLLDALLISAKHQKNVQSDRVISPNPQMFVHTLADYLYPTPVDGVNVTAEEIDNALRSILIDENGEGGTSISEDGSYQIGLLQGHAPQEKTSKYIGKEARKKHRQEVIVQLEAELVFLQKEHDELKEKLRVAESRIEDLKEELAQFPTEQEVSDAFYQLEMTRRDVLALDKEVSQKNTRLKQIASELQQVKSQLRQLTEEQSLAASEEAYEQALNVMYQYQRQLSDMQVEWNNYHNYQGNLTQLQDRLEGITLDVDELKGECNRLSSEVSKCTFQLEQIEHRLKELGAEEIQEKIEQILQRLREIPEALLQLTREQEKVGHEITSLQQEVERTGQELQFVISHCKIGHDVFVDDLKLQLVPTILEKNMFLEKNTLEQAEQVKAQFGELLHRFDREKLNSNLKDAFFKEQAILVEYRLTQDHILELDQLPDAGDVEILQIMNEHVKQISRRIHVVMEYEGKRVSPYYVLEKIEKDITLQQSILNERDRELYEEIILNSVGRIIRTRINRAEEWVKKINQLMEERDTSSGLTFSIRWKPKTADMEDEMDTRDLVDLLRADARILREEDIQRVTQHFRSKINRAKENLEESGFGETLHQAIKEILDYRQWFAFTLYYKREGEQKKELTNNVFFTFSGGEKAMAMYIPLFSAAYSRYSEANDDAPYIISLDEAFAGVDENNIRDMFDLVEKLGFNYIMNSQAVWGDYDTVSSLAICELVRPKNAPYVTVIRYHWDGHIRHLMHDTEDLFEDEQGVEEGVEEEGDRNEQSA